ncbi:protein PXR1 [Biomphalaria glabrata]|nr:protein PXR1-like [Biomphalaria glabrata]
MERCLMLRATLVFAILGTALADDGAWSFLTWIPIAAGATIVVFLMAFSSSRNRKKESEEKKEKESEKKKEKESEKKKEKESEKKKEKEREKKSKKKKKEYDGVHDEKKDMEERQKEY